MRIIEASAPGRCGIIGNPSDIYGGVVVSSAVNARNGCRLSIGKDGPKPEDRRLLDAALQVFPLEEPFGLELYGTVPKSSGLSGSTAMLASIMLCLSEASGLGPDLASDAGRSEFALKVRQTERWRAKIMCGWQDAFMILHGGLQEMSFEGKCPNTDLEGVDPSPANLRPLIAGAFQFLLVTTGVERLSGSIHTSLSDRWKSGDPEVKAAATRFGEMGAEGAAAIKSGDMERLGSLMNESHDLMKAIGGTGPEVDRLAEDCLKAGGTGAKLAGAGLGGTIIVLCEDRERVRKNLQEMGRNRFLFPEPQDGLRLEPGSEL